MKPSYWVALIAIIIALVAGWRLVFQDRNDEETIHTTTAFAVEGAPVRTMTMHDERILSGGLEAKYQFNIHAKVTGKVKILNADIGQAVKNGDLIAQIEDEEFQQQVAQSEAELAVAKAQFRQIEASLRRSGKEYDRILNLYKQKIASESELDAAKLGHEADKASIAMGKARIRQAQAAVKSARIRLSYTQIKVSWNDPEKQKYVAQLFVNEGDTIIAGSPLAVMVGLNPMLGVLYVTEKDYTRLSEGQSALVTSDVYPDRIFPARIAHMAPSLSELSRQSRVEIEINNDEHILKPGMFIRANIRFLTHEDVSAVPISALTIRDGKSGVFWVESGITDPQPVQFIPLETGFVYQDWVEIVQPELSHGYVITVGKHLLNKDNAIKLVLEKADEPA